MTTRTRKLTESEDLAQALLKALGDEHFFVTGMGLGLRTGSTGWRWPGSAVSWCTEQGARLHPNGAAEGVEPEHYDSRLTIDQVARFVAQAERQAYFRTHNIPEVEQSAYAAGAWHEYLAPAFGLDENRPWPDDCYMAVCVIPGANEGEALRVMTVEETPRLMLVGKSIGESWGECYR